jgi:hypothetical protein
MLRKGKNYNPEKTGKSGDFMLPQNFSGSKKRILQTSNFNYKCSLLKFDQLET